MYIYISLLSVLVVAFAKIYIVTPCHVIAVGGLCPKSRGFGGIFSVQRNLNLLATLQCFARFAPKHPKYVYILYIYLEKPLCFIRPLKNMKNNTLNPSLFGYRVSKTAQTAVFC